LMRALEAGDLLPSDPSLGLHLDRCLGCRGCEPVCPSGVGYGQGLAAARALITARRGVTPLTRAALAALTSSNISPTVYAFGRLLRATGLPRRLAGWGRLRFALGMLAATVRNGERGGGARERAKESWSAAPSLGARDRPGPATSVFLFRGCVMEGLFAHVHDATVRTLAVNGYAVREVAGQTCCGALHAHAGLRREAQALAWRNIAALGGGSDPIVVNSAGCGALLKEYGDLCDDERARSFAARVRDVTELLAERGPRSGAPIDATVVYDPPCHLLHAQRVAEPPLQVLAAIPVLRVIPTPGAPQCCGSAGLFTLVEPTMSRAVLAPKLAALRDARPQIVATGNPGCLMQVGAGLAAAGISATVRHPVELLDESYEAAGYYA
jgi:glycolate oxidase iron-sulfur subunit